MQKRRAAGTDLHRTRRAQRVQKGHSVLLGVEDIDVAAAAPIPAFAARFRPATPHGRSRDALTVFARSQKDLSDLEERDIVDRPAYVALDGGEQTGQEAGAHIGEVRRNRIGESKGGGRRRRTIPPPPWRRTTR